MLIFISPRDLKSVVSLHVVLKLEEITEEHKTMFEKSEWGRLPRTA